MINYFLVCFLLIIMNETNNAVIKSIFGGFGGKLLNK